MVFCIIYRLSRGGCAGVVSSKYITGSQLKFIKYELFCRFRNWCVVCSKLPPPKPPAATVPSPRPKA